MKFRIFTLLSLALFINATVNAQEVKRCVTVEAVEKRNEQYPGYKAAIERTFQQAKEHAATKSSSNEIFRIPVVVHVVYNTPDQNIPDSLIYNQIEVLNQDYRRLNPDSVQTRTEFKPVAGDAGIEFYLASQDPDGNWTTGITRTETDVESFVSFSNFTPDGIKDTAEGGVAAWDTERYLNIWVGNLAVFGSPFILGFAYPPAGAPNWPSGQEAPSPDHEGVVVHWQVFGRNNPQATGPLAATNRGRTATHEVGHYLGLRHIWGDGGGFSGQDGCTVDDGIEDTPNAANAQQQTCDLNANTCTDSPVDFPDMIENYMDYSDENCMNMFTEGQIAIMRSILETSRASVAADFPTTGIFDPAVAELDIYPNPTEGIFTVSYGEAAEKLQSAELWDAFGRKVQNLNANSNTTNLQVDLSGYAKGVYFLRSYFEGGVKVSKVVVR